MWYICCVSCITQVFHIIIIIVVDMLLRSWWWLIILFVFSIVFMFCLQLWSYTHNVFLIDMQDTTQKTVKSIVQSFHCNKRMLIVWIKGAVFWGSEQRKTVNIMIDADTCNIRAIVWKSLQSRVLLIFVRDMKILFWILQQWWFKYRNMSTAAEKILNNSSQLLCWTNAHHIVYL